ncbi:ribosomal protection tetracycline resistance protein [Saccharothrix tamanrassetensis]|uniref:Ribosomal protection tetracycline resistance protein n=1 Tax=Saccharothrix tamanrassetensis TaxID=1051531 RepID=A0A841CH00_9PSEU|nr:TetM/TetW/TetO/TetS family tetracycline resistance ribosomal protection protein [Saccharothrix tamanrassetensis]MBB5955407.1 ribosomal protection tetracycline resistance protein [Saccharothrix tamanrassetensis]
MRTLNLGILAHVDAGKTSLTERLLHAAGVIDAVGSVDDGSTQTDSLALERQRGITIRSAVVSFVVDDVTVNLIDTPGHPDFIAEVERALGVLDGAVLVVSAVEGVQPQTRVLMRALRRLRIPTLLFVNKTDRAGADPERVVREIAARLTPDVAPVSAGVAALTELVTRHDDAVLRAYVEGGVGARRVRESFAALSRRAVVHPVFSGSAITGAGVDALMAALPEFLPAVCGDASAPVSGSVFKVERGPAGEKIAYVRMFAGTVRVRDRLEHGKVTAISVFSRGTAQRSASVSAGHVARVWGLDVRIGDSLGVARGAGPSFAPPTLETVVVPARAEDAGALHAVLTRLAEQDPLIDLRQDDGRREIAVSLYGEVQKEVLQAELADAGLEVGFRATTTICLERPVGSGEDVAVIDTDGNPYLATVGLRVDPAPAGSGVEFRLEVELGSMPFAFFVAVEEAVRDTLRRGGVHGWQVVDCVVTMTRSGYWARQSHSHGTFDKSMSSTAGDFRDLTPLVLMNALARAGVEVLEPVHSFRLEVPADVLGIVSPVLARLRAVPRTSVVREGVCVLEGDVPAAHVRELQVLLPGLTRGEGVLESVFSHHSPGYGGQAG